MNRRGAGYDRREFARIRQDVWFWKGLLFWAVLAAVLLVTAIWRAGAWIVSLF